MAPAASSRSSRILVVFEWFGGNDGLNTIVPYGDASYYRHRPTIGIPETDVLEIDAHHEPTDRWRHQATIDLEPWPSAFSPSWRQIEVGAQNPFYRFHPTIDRLRFRLRRVHPEAPLTGTIVIGPVTGVRPRLVDADLPPPTDVRTPVFTTWGGAHQPHLEAGAALGLTLHQAPVEIGRAHV